MTSATSQSFEPMLGAQRDADGEAAARNGSGTSVPNRSWARNMGVIACDWEMDSVHLHIAKIALQPISVLRPDAPALWNSISTHSHAARQPSRTVPQTRSVSAAVIGRRSFIHRSHCSM